MCSLVPVGEQAGWGCGRRNRNLQGGRSPRHIPGQEILPLNVNNYDNNYNYFLMCTPYIHITIKKGRKNIKDKPCPKWQLPFWDVCVCFYILYIKMSSFFCRCGWNRFPQMKSTWSEETQDRHVSIHWDNKTIVKYIQSQPIIFFFLWGSCMCIWKNAHVLVILKHR